MKFNKKYKDSEINKIIKSIVILVDTREKVNSHILMWLKHNKINYISYGLSFGDYSFMIPKNDNLGILEDIYFNDDIAIERKANAEEISGNFTENRERFEREFERGNGKIRLLIEDTSYSNICDHKYNTKTTVNSFISSLHSFQEYYNTPFMFTEKKDSGVYIYNTFKYYIKNILKNG